MEIQKLEIRRIKEDELEKALQLVWEVFEKEIKPSYSEEGVQEFSKFIDYHFMRNLYNRGEIIFWGAFEEEMIGTVAVRTDGHISLFFVKNEYQGLGIGKALFQMMYNYCVNELKVKKITVNAAPQSVAKYIHMGLRQMGNLEEQRGIRSVPMEMYASPTLVKPVRFCVKKDRKKLWLTIGIIALLLIGGIIFAGVRAYHSFVEFVMEEDGWNYSREPKESELPETQVELTGVDAIEVYEEENLSYEIVNEAYSFVDNEKINTVIDFNVQYPKLVFSDTSIADRDVTDRINEEIYNCAMETVEEIYFQPSIEIKEKVLSAQPPVLVSYVTYKVTYQSESFISIVIEEQAYKGSQEDYVYDFRTLNINLKDGTIYQVKDLIHINEEFLKEWIMTMRSEAKNKDLLSELHKKNLIKILNGENEDTVYAVEYFFDKEGIQIGLSFSYKEGDKNDHGFAWVTAPFSFEEIEKFTTDSSIWNEMN